MKKLSALIVALLLAVSMISPAFAASAGTYTGYNETNYYNPDTGNIDDGGTANAELGVGMCRSATSEDCFLEVDSNGNAWLTVRLLLQSNCRDIKLYTRNGYDSYSQVNYEVMQENSSGDYVDYRFRVNSTDNIQLKATMYVIPMGRDVLWYMTCKNFTPGSGNFVVSIDTSKPASNNNGGSTHNNSTPAENKGAEAKPGESAAPTETVSPSATPAPSAKINPSASVTNAPDDDVDTAAESSGGLSTGGIIGIIAAVVVVAAAVIYFVRKKNTK